MKSCNGSQSRALQSLTERLNAKNSAQLDSMGISAEIKASGEIREASIRELSQFAC